MSQTTIKEFLEKAKGNWVTATKCNVGDILKVTGQPQIDDKTFEKKIYLVMDITHERTNEAMKLRLSASAVNNLVGVFTDNAANWVGKRIKVAGKTMYAGLGKEGLIFIPA